MNSKFETQLNDMLQSFEKFMSNTWGEAKSTFKSTYNSTPILSVLAVCFIISLLISIAPLALFLFCAYFVIKLFVTTGKATAVQLPNKNKEGSNDEFGQR